MSGVSVPPSLVIARHSAWWDSFRPLLGTSAGTAPRRLPAARPADTRP